MKRFLECVGVAAWLMLVPISTTAAIVFVAVLLLVPAPNDPKWPEYVKRFGGMGLHL